MSELWQMLFLGRSHKWKVSTSMRTQWTVLEPPQPPLDAFGKSAQS